MEIILEVVFYHQLCFLHFYRNLKGKLTLKSTKQIYTLWKKIKEFLKYPEERDKKAYIHDKYSGINKFRDRINEAEAWWIFSFL